MRASMWQPLTSTTQSPGRIPASAIEGERAAGSEVGGIAERGEIVGVQPGRDVPLLGCERQRPGERAAPRSFGVRQLVAHEDLGDLERDGNHLVFDLGRERSLRARTARAAAAPS